MIKASLLWQVGLIANVKLHFFYLKTVFCKFLVYPHNNVDLGT